MIETEKLLTELRLIKEQLTKLKDKEYRIEKVKKVKIKLASGMKVLLEKGSYLVLHKVLFNIKEYNKPHLEGETYLLCPNHTSEFDGPIYWASDGNMRIMAKKELFQIPLVASFLKWVGVVPVDRQAGGTAAITEFIELIQNSHNGEVFMMFAQGTISDINKNTLGRIKPGAFFIASKAGVRIVPVYEEQPRIFRKSRYVYGEPYYCNVLNEKGKRDKQLEEIERLKWMQEILRLQQVAIELENRPIRKLKLNKKHSNNNLG